jgi:hypothetical protein
MCPGCIGSALLLLSSASSAGGLAALKLRVMRRTRTMPKRVGGERDGPPPHSDNTTPESPILHERAAAHLPAARPFQAVGYSINSTDARPRQLSS